MENQNFSNEASYYLMKNGFILRLENPLDEKEIPLLIKANLFEPKGFNALNQEQANYRVAIFRDEILEMDEYNQRVFGISH
jgi:hypothetical protein